MEAGPLKWLQKWKERKRLKQRQSTRQLMGIRKLLPHGVAIPGGSLVFFLIHPDNLSVLSAEGIRQRGTACLFKGGKWSYNIPLERLIDYATKCNVIIAKGV